MLRSH